MTSSLLPEIKQYLVDKLRAATATDYIYDTTRIDNLPGDDVIRVMEDAVEHFSCHSGRPATIADLADLTEASVRMWPKVKPLVP